MRRTTSIIVVLLLAVPVLFAQDALMKGALDLGGSFGFTSQSGDLYENAAGDGQSVITFAPDMGYFLMDNLSLGLLLDYSSRSQGDDKASTFMYGPKLNYYLGAMGSGNPFVHAAFIFGSSTTEVGGTEFKHSTSEMQFGAGYLVWLNDHVGLDVLLGYSMDSITPDGGDAVKGSAFGIMIGFKMFHF